MNICHIHLLIQFSHSFFDIRKGESCMIVPLASSVFATLEHAAPEKRAELQQGLFVYVAKIAVVFV